MAARSKGKIMLKQKRNFILAFIISFGLIFASTAIATSSNTIASTPPYPVITSQTYVQLYNKVIDSVVTVIVEVEGEGQRKFINNLPPDSPFNQLFKDEDGKEPTMPRAVGKGSGYIVSEGGLVYTNHHVVYGAAEEKPNMRIADIVIVWHDGTFRKATVVASDPVADVAILQITKEGDETFQALKFADSDLATPGTMVAAIGTPLDHPFSITSGIISGVGRPTGKGVWVKMLQTDTVINKGNSGGPLFNIKGEVIGMNTLIMSPSGFFIGIGYAVPSNTIIEVASQLIDHGEYIRPWIGVSLSNLNDDFKDRFNVTNDAVVFINVKPDGPAGKSGFKSYDIVLEWNGESIDSDQLIASISASKPGDTYTLLVRRVKDFDNNLYEDITITLTIGAMPVTGMK